MLYYLHPNPGRNPMKKKISLLVALLICAGCLWAAMPKTIHFAGRTYYLSKIEEDGTSVFETTDIISSFSIVPTPIDSPKNQAERFYKGWQPDLYKCQMEFCSADDVLVQCVLATERRIDLNLFRITKQGGFIVYTEAEHPLSEYRRALCQFPLDILSK